MFKSYLKFQFLLLLFFAIASPADQANAEIELDLFPNTFDTFSVAGQFHVFFRHDSNPSFGAAVDSRGRTETTFGETVAKLGFTFEKKLQWTELEGRVSRILMSTINADVYGAADDESQADLNEGYLIFKKINQSPFDIKVGRQNIFIEKSFISGDANPEDAAIWISAHKSFPFAVRIDGNFGKLKTLAFWADTELYSQQGDQRELGKRGKEGVSFAGINMHYDFSDTAYLYGGYYRKIDESNITFTSFSPGGKDNNLKALYPKIAKEWHPTKNGDLLPMGFVAGSHKKVWWQCKKGHEWDAVIGKRVSGQGCPHCDVLCKEAGCSSELDYTEQSSWMLFLKYLDALKHERATEAELVGCISSPNYSFQGICSNSSVHY